MMCGGARWTAESMTPFDEPPAWVADAVFYQIFPDRFARSERVARPGPLEPWDAPPTTHGFKGGDLLGIVEHLDYLSALGINALYLTPIFASASNHRYHTYDYYRSIRCWAVTRRCASCSTPATRAVCASCSTASSTTRAAASGPSTTSSRTAPRSPYLDWFYVDPLTSPRVPSAARVPDRRTSSRWSAKR